MRQYELVERVQKYDPSASEALLNRAYVYAMKAHGHQKRASGDPFFSHPLEVAAILTELKLDDATIAAALLHDVIEDTDVTRAEIDQKFGQEIGALVEGLTKIKRLDLVTKKAEQAENFRKLLVAISSDIRVLLIKLADRLHNMRTLEHMKPESRRRVSRGNARDLCPAGRPHGHADAARGARAAGLQVGIARRLQDRGRQARGHPQEERRPGRGDRRRPAGQARRRRPGGRGLWPREEALLDLAQDGEPADLAGAAVRHLRLPRRGGRAGRMLPGARHRALGLARGARPFQGLHLHAQAEQLPVDPHHGGGPAPPVGRVADPHPRHGPDRRVRGGRARPLQGRRARGREWRRPQRRRRGAQGQPLHLAAPAGRHAARGRQSRGVPGAHQARAVPGPGVLLHAQGPPHRPAARRHADRFRLCRAHRRRQRLRRRRHQRPAAAAHHPAQERRPGRDPDGQGPDAARRLGAHRRHRQGALLHPPRRARRPAQAVLRARPPPAGLGLPQDRPGLHRREAQEGPLPPDAEIRRGGARRRRPRRAAGEGRDPRRGAGGGACPAGHPAQVFPSRAGPGRGGLVQRRQGDRPQVPLARQLQRGRSQAGAADPRPARTTCP